jgi:transposase-like protein
MVTDQLKRDEAAKQEVLPSVEHRQHRYLSSTLYNSICIRDRLYQAREVRPWDSYKVRGVCGC